MLKLDGQSLQAGSSNVATRKAQSKTYLHLSGQTKIIFHISWQAIVARKRGVRDPYIKNQIHV